MNKILQFRVFGINEELESSRLQKLLHRFLILNHLVQ